MHFYDGYHFWGMHLIWWIVWIGLIILIFALPGSFIRRRPKKETPLEILKKKYAAGEISTEEYQERKEVLERDWVK
jgi:putative membrane protein